MLQQRVCQYNVVQVKQTHQTGIYTKLQLQVKVVVKLVEVVKRAEHWAGQSVGSTQCDNTAVAVRLTLRVQNRGRKKCIFVNNYTGK